MAKKSNIFWFKGRLSDKKCLLQNNKLQCRHSYLVIYICFVCVHKNSHKPFIQQTSIRLLVTSSFLPINILGLRCLLEMFDRFFYLINKLHLCASIYKKDEA